MFDLLWFIPFLIGVSLGVLMICIVGLFAQRWR